MGDDELGAAPGGQRHAVAQQRGLAAAPAQLRKRGAPSEVREAVVREENAHRGGLPIDGSNPNVDPRVVDPAGQEAASVLSISCGELEAHEGESLREFGAVRADGVDREVSGKVAALRRRCAVEDGVEPRHVEPPGR